MNPNTRKTAVKGIAIALVPDPTPVNDVMAVGVFAFGITKVASAIKALIEGWVDDE